MSESKVMETNQTSNGATVRKSFYYEVKCNACRMGIQRGNRLEASVQMVNHMFERHNTEDWLNILNARIMQMFWDSPYSGHSALEVTEVMDFMGLLAKDGDIPYEYWQRFNNKNELNGA